MSYRSMIKKGYRGWEGANVIRFAGLTCGFERGSSWILNKASDSESLKPATKAPNIAFIRRRVMLWSF